jgi:hypothetical protein
MTPKLPQTVRQPDSDWQGFLKLARHVSETIGTEFLSMLARQLAGMLEAKCGGCASAPRVCIRRPHE